MSKRTEKVRVLRALHLGPVKQADFSFPTCDGGKIITRVAARIYDLREDGYDIPPSTRDDDGTAVYRLVGEPQLVRDVESPGGLGTSSLPLGAEQLFDPAEATEPRPHYAVMEA